MLPKNRAHKETNHEEVKSLNKLQIVRVWILALMIFYTGFPFTYSHKLISPAIVSSILLFLLFLTFAIFWKDTYKIKKSRVSILISIFIMLFAILSQILFYPFNFQVYDLWFLSFGAYYMFSKSTLKEMLKFLCILLAPPSLLLLCNVCWSSINIFLALIAGFVIAILYSEKTERTPKDIKKYKKATMIIAFSVLVFLIFSLQYLTFDPGIKKQGKILLDEGHGTIESSLIPLNTDYNSSASFGHEKLVEFLRSYDYLTEFTNETLTPQLLSNYDILVLIMCSGDYSSDEIRAIKEFVRDGGGLLVVSDHTNMHNIMNVFNQITENFGIHINFDTIWLKTSEKSNLFYARHPILWNLNRVYLSVGGSLDIFSNAKPVLTARYADFSDIGDPNNVNRAYLGNEIHDPYENVGDIILIAVSQHEEGRVVVFSDSSYFQNTVLPKNYEFALTVFDWLNRENTFCDFPMYLLLSLFVFLMLVVAVALYYRIEHILPLCLILSLICALMVSSGINTSFYPAPDLDQLEHKVLLDLAHQNSYATYWEIREWTNTGLDALYKQILRVGYHPFVEESKKLTYNDLKKYDTLILIAPNAPYSREEINAIKKFVNEGGGLLIVDGDRSERTIDPLLTEFNVTLGKSLTEPVPDLNNPSIIRQYPFGGYIIDLSDHRISRNATNVSSINPCLVSGGEPVAFIAEEPMMSVILYGGGRVVVIGDDMFFANYVLETTEGYPIDINKLRFTWNILKFLTEG